MKNEFELSERHISTNFEVLLSCYLEGKVKLSGTPAAYYFSKIIKSTNWNHGVFSDPTVKAEFEFVVAEAEKRKVSPAFFIREANIDIVSKMMGDLGDIGRERWMICLPSTLASVPPIPNLEVIVTENVTPTDDYGAVLESLFEEQSINNIFRDFYVPTLMSSELRLGTHSVHAVAYLDGKAVGCGSTYRRDELAGLYNVGTVFNQQRQGIGAAISHALAHRTFVNGASEIFLQCVVGTHVERLYKNIGFLSAEVPGIFVVR